MIRTLLLLFVLSAASAYAQNDGELGLDLSEDAAKKEEPKPAQPARPAPKAESGEAASDKPVANKGPAVERDITQDDRVKSVQKKLYLKRYRFELAPYFSFSVNDPYYTKLGGTIRGAFYLADTLAFSARFSYLGTFPTEDVKVAKAVLQSRIFFSVPIWWAMGDFEWSPFYGKFSIFNSILFIDGYLAAGGGAVYTETAAISGVKPAFDFGGGLRFVVKDWLAINVALMNTTYVDTPAGTTKGSTQNVMMFNVGLSVFFPFRSTFREAE